MERINEFTGKPIPDNMPPYSSKPCQECGKQAVIHDCVYCGAPNCCHGCGCPSLIDQPPQ